MGGEVIARIRALAGNRWAVAGVLGAAGLGAYTLLRGRSSTPAPASSAGTAGESGSAGGVAGTGEFPNTYATDVAGAVGNVDGLYAERLAEFQTQLGSDFDALEAMQKKQGAQVADVTKSVAALKATTKAPAKVTPTPKPKPASSSTAKSGWRTITVKRGDTLGALAARYHTSIGALVKANNISNPNVIGAGRKLRVPG